jgi:hypothetical protein
MESYLILGAPLLLFIVAAVLVTVLEHEGRLRPSGQPPHSPRTRRHPTRLLAARLCGPGSCEADAARLSPQHRRPGGGA